MKKRNNMKGITLIALIVTVIVASITIGITLNLIAGSNGIISKSAHANDEHQKAVVKEDVELTLAGIKANYFAAENRREYANFEEYWIDQLPLTTAQKCSLSKDEDIETGDVLITYETKKGKLYDISTDPLTGQIVVSLIEGAESDTTPPTIGAPVVGISSIRATIRDARGSGVAAYMVKESNSIPTADDVNWVEINENPLPKTYTLSVTGLSMNTTYYIFAKDANGNVSSVREATTQEVDAATPANLTVDSITWSGANATVTFVTTTEYKIQLSNDGSNWSEPDVPNSITVPSGTTIYARLSDDDGNSGTSYAAHTPYRQGTVTYNANGGTGSVPTEQNVQHTSTVNVNFSTIPTRENYVFLGWSTDYSATTATYTSTGTTSFTMGTTDVILYAVWEQLYTVTYNANTGTGNVPTSTQKRAGSTVTVNFTTLPTKANYQFLGWSTNSSATSATYTSSGTTTFSMPSSNVTLYAIWEQLYSVTYNANGGTGSVPATVEDVRSGQTVTVNFTTTPTKESYTFAGWATSDTATTPTYTSSGTKTFTMGSENVTLYAVWNFDQNYASQHPELHIPTGYTHTVGTVSDGYVIQDSNGNEFVWIPISSSSNYYKTMGAKNYYMSSSSASSAEQPELTTIAGDKLGTFPNNSVISSNTSIVDRPEADVVNAAGGFWVGRYEAGVPNVARSSYIAGVQNSSDSDYSAANTYWSGKIIYSKVNCEPVRMITQTKSLELANNFGTGNAGTGTVAWQSGLITGAEFDAVCRFIGQSTCDSDCTIWGNYRNLQSKTYTDLYHSSHNSSDWVHSTGSIAKVSSDNYWIFPTGIFVNNSNGTTEKKHIFDIAGNVWEWTTEVPAFDSSHAVRRGGSTSNYGNGHLASTRSGNPSATTFTYSAVGCRIVIYVK